jgi:PAS domain S-box-containing protein
MLELSVLIAEPSKTGRHIFTQLVSRLGVNVTFTTSAKETFHEVGKKQYHLICLSQKLPDDEGVNVCAELRKLEQYNATTVLLVTPQKKTSVNYDFAFTNGVTQLIGRHELHRFVHAVELMVERNKPIEGQVLVVEDSRSQAEYICVLLKSMGLDVNVVCSAEQAIKELTKTRYSLVIVDIVLAGNMTGVELVDYIRTLPEPQNRVRVLAMSAYEDSSRRIELFNLGIDDFINKPIVREELIARVRGLLSQHYILVTAQENERLSKSLSQLLDNSPDVIARFDVDGILLFMNPRMEQELGVNKSDEIGKHYSELGLSVESLELYQKAIKELVATQQVARYQLSGKNEVEFDIQFSPESVDGKLVSFITSARDITELTVLQKQLIASKDAVEMASEAKSRFLATMSHELRTPLNAISGFGQLMKQKLHQREGEFVEFNEYLDLIGESSVNLTHLIDDVLDLSSIEADEMTSQLQSVDIRPYVEGIKAAFNGACKTRQISLNLAFTGLKSDRVVIDKAKTLTIMNNLIDNAIKFSHFGGEVKVMIFVSAQNLTLHVVDKGIGIPQDFTDKLFAPFEQVDNSRTRDYGGTGLGLSIVNKFTQFLGGKITIESVEDKGTKCVLVLPLGTTELLANKPTQTVVGANMMDFADYQFSGQKVLVVEDSIVNQQLMCACLDNYGLEVKVAENGVVGVEQSIKWQPDLVLMDMHMPKMDGLEATQRIRQVEGLKELPIFGLSADAHKEYIEKAYDSGLNEYLTKPVDFNLLCRLMNQYLNTDSEPEASLNQAVNNKKETPMSEETVLNVQKGISYAANNSGLFKQLLGTFISQYDRSGEELATFFNNGQNDDAMKLAHTMKGVCSTLGMDSLSEVAKHMQFGFNNNKLDDIGDHLVRYNELLVIAIRESKAYCED